MRAVARQRDRKQHIAERRHLPTTRACESDGAEAKVPGARQRIHDIGGHSAR